MKPTLIPTLLLLATVTTVASAGVPAPVERAVERLAALGGDPLAPVEWTTPELESTGDRPRLAIARSVRAGDAGLDSTALVQRGDVLPLLGQARSLRHLGLPARALRWYGMAATADRDSTHLEDIVRERALCVVALADSASVVAEARALASGPQRVAVDAALAPVLALFHTVADSSTRARFAFDAAGDPSPMGPELALYLGRSLALAGAAPRGLALVEGLLDAPDRLTPRQLAQALRGVADLHAHAGQHREATRLYRHYREADLGTLSAWASFQLAGYAARAGRDREAHDLYRSLCQRSARTPWQDEACRRQQQAARLLAPAGGGGAR